MVHTAMFEGSDKLLHNMVEYRGTDAVGKLCRVLKEGTLHIYRNGKVCMIVNVEARAKKSLSENDTGMKHVKYVPFDATVIRNSATK